MADSAIFNFVTTALEERTALDRLESRGTVRIALKEAGLEVASVDKEQMGVVLDKVLPGALRERGIDEPESVCSAIRSDLAGVADDAPAGDRPEQVFARLGGS
ncbi:MAG: hypothetical protein MJE66_12525 [Proteobacteria bacterium]|nr:hypothetical protein [Pseudomonadota bacterium]